METGKYVTKTSDFAANAIPGVRQYDNARPSDYLKMIMAVDNGNLDFSADQTERLMARMPETMVGIKANSRGALEFSAIKKADFLSPSNPAGTSVKGSGVVDILVADTIMEGAMPYTSARNILDVWRAKSGAEQIPFFSARKASKSVAPNADAIDLAETIGDYAFVNCTSATEINLGNSLKSIGLGAFTGCTLVTEITVPESTLP